MEKKSKKKYLIGALAVLLVVVAVGGTIAWLTAANSVTNNFTVGEIKPPTDPDEGGTTPEKPGEDENGDLTGNIYEILDKDMTITPGGSVTKKAWIGVGANSEDAYVFAYVDNNMMESTDNGSAYFVLNPGWVPVAAAGTNEFAVSGVDNAYTGGLFAWCGLSGNATAGTTPVSIKAATDGNVWTGKPIFDEVVIPNECGAADFKKDCTMDIWCYLYADVNGATPQAALSEVVEWAKSPARIQGTATTTEP